MSLMNKIVVMYVGLGKNFFFFYIFEQMICHFSKNLQYFCQILAKIGQKSVNLANIRQNEQKLAKINGNKVFCEGEY